MPWQLGLVYKPMGPTIQLGDEIDPERKQEEMVRSFKIDHTLPDKFKEIMDKKDSEQGINCSNAKGFAYLFGFC